MKIPESERVQKANQIERPVEELLPIKQAKFSSKDGIKVKIQSKKSAQLDEELKKWCFDLLERNMKSVYEQAKTGWNEEEKRTEMFEEQAYFLIAIDSRTNKPVGFSHFRFDLDADSAVVYCYELQIEANMRKIGLGKFMMQMLENLCRRLDLEKVVLTCFKHNVMGQKFFKDKMRYELDDTDLSEDDPSVDYCIYSKVLVD